jgi:hypothetical protein
VTLSMLRLTEPAQLWGTHMIKVNIHCHENLRFHSRFVFKGYVVKMLRYCRNWLRWFVDVFSPWKDITLQYAVTRSIQIIVSSLFYDHLRLCTLCSWKIVVKQHRNRFQTSWLQFHQLLLLLLLLLLFRTK